MKQLSMIFSEFVKLKTDEKTIKASIKEALLNSKMYQDRLAELQTMKADLKMIEKTITDEFTKDLDKLDNIKIEIEENKMMTTDVALTLLLKGESVEVEHEGQKYEAVMSAKWKKVKQYALLLH